MLCKKVIILTMTNWSTVVIFNRVFNRQNIELFKSMSNIDINISLCYGASVNVAQRNRVMKIATQT